MNKRVLIILFVMMMGLVLPTAVSRTILLAQSQTIAAESSHMDDVIPQGTPIKTSWHPQDDGIAGYYNLALFGPDSCTSFGDPYSPFNSPWAPGFYTYQFRISIPADYPYDEVRVELFDPDSINAENVQSFTIGRTNAAISEGLAPDTTGSCNSSQTNPCLIHTGELELFGDGLLDSLPVKC